MIIQSVKSIPQEVNNPKSVVLDWVPWMRHGWCAEGLEGVCPGDKFLGNCGRWNRPEGDPIYCGAAAEFSAPNGSCGPGWPFSIFPNWSSEA